MALLLPEPQHEVDVFLDHVPHHLRLRPKGQAHCVLQVETDVNQVGYCVQAFRSPDRFAVQDIVPSVDFTTKPWSIGKPTSVVLFSNFAAPFEISEDPRDIRFVDFSPRDVTHVHVADNGMTLQLSPLEKDGKPHLVLSIFSQENLIQQIFYDLPDIFAAPSALADAGGLHVWF